MTPFFLIDKQKLDKNILEFKKALEKIWPNYKLGYSVKTNSLPWLLKYLNEKELMAEVVSDEEYKLAILCGFKPEQIIFNGPIKGEKLFLNSIRNNSIVNIDSEKEIQLFEEHIHESKENIGIRLNISPEYFNKEDIGYFEDGFRFGFSEKNDRLSDVIDAIRKDNKDNKIGIHIHCNSITRSLEVYRSIAMYLKYIINRYNISPSFIDIGGGFFGGVEGKPTQEDYVDTIYQVLKDSVDIEETTLILEPGSAIIGSPVEFHTKVIDVKNTDKSRIITTDGSRINIDPLWSKNKYSYRINSSKLNEEKDLVNKQVICGYTCMDHDRIMILNNLEEIDINDRIIYEKVGAYTMTFGGPFIKYYPKVYLKDNCDLKLIRDRIYPKDYYNMHNI